MTPRYKLRTLLILLAILPPLLWIGWGKYQVCKAEQERQRTEEREWKLAGFLMRTSEAQTIYERFKPDLPIAIPSHSSAKPRQPIARL